MERRLRKNEIGRAQRAVDYLNENQTMLYSSSIPEVQADQPRLGNIMEVRLYEATIPNGLLRSFLHGKSYEVIPFITKKHDNGDITLISSRRAIKHVIFHADHLYAK